MADAAAAVSSRPADWHCLRTSGARMPTARPLDDVFAPAAARRRRDLLPWWIKGFCWLFMAFGVASAVCLGLGFTDVNPRLAFYGFESHEPFSPSGLLVIVVGLLKGATAYALWFEKDAAVRLGRADALLGIALCVVSMLIVPFLADGFNVQIRLELALLIPYLLKLNAIRRPWEAQREG